MISRTSGMQSRRNTRQTFNLVHPDAELVEDVPRHERARIVGGRTRLPGPVPAPRAPGPRPLSPRLVRDRGWRFGRRLGLRAVPPPLPV